MNDDEIVIEGEVPLPESVGGGKIPWRMRIKNMSWQCIATLVAGIFIGLGLGFIWL